jgi:hypothetical protein
LYNGPQLHPLPYRERRQSGVTEVAAWRDNGIDVGGFAEAAKRMVIARFLVLRRY